jgi:uncharacterized protein involved in outer membrane biogenesis
MIVIAIGVIVIIAAICVVGLEALAGGAGKDRIAAALSKALGGVPVTIGQLSISLFPPSLVAGQIQIGGGRAGVSVTSLRVDPDLMSFLPGHTKTIKRVDLIGLTVTGSRDASGHWILPVPPVGHSASPAPSGPPKPAGAPSSNSNVNLDALRVRDGTIRLVDDSLHTTAAITAVAADVSMQSGVISAPSFTGQVGQTVVNGSASYAPTGVALHISSPSIENADLPSLFALAGLRPYPGLSIGGHSPLTMTTQIGADMQSLSVSGTADLEHLTVGKIALDSVHAPFRFDKKIFAMDPMTFALYGGHERGRVQLDISKATPAYAIRTTITGLDVDRALTSMTTMRHTLSGTAHLTAQVNGTGTSSADIQRSLTGTMGFGVVKGVVTNFPLLTTINKTLGASASSAQSTKFDSLTGTATISGGHAETKDLTLKAGDLTMTGQGTYGFDQSLNFKTLTELSAAKSASLAQQVALVKSLETQQGTLAVPVTVGGTAASPKFGVDMKTLAKQHLKGGLQQQLSKFLPH